MIPGIKNINSIGSTVVLRKASPSLTTTNSNIDFSHSPVKNSNSKVFQGHRNSADQSKVPSTRAVKYNPITNPIPDIIQNPAILKQRSLAKSNSQTFMSAGSNIFR